MRKITTLEVLEKARALITPRNKWVKGWGKIGPRGGGATCAVGAVRAVTTGNVMCENTESERARKALGGVIGSNGGWAVVSYNDSHSHECVLQMFDTAIEREKQKREKQNERMATNS